MLLAPKIFAIFFEKPRKRPVHKHQFGDHSKCGFCNISFFSCRFWVLTGSPKCALIFCSTNEMIGPKWHQSTIQKVPYTQLRSQGATVQNYIEDSVQSGINFFFFQFWSFESMILNQITGGITFATTRPLLLHFTINAFRQTPITKNRWTHQHIQTAFTYFKGKCPILIQHFSNDLSELS